MAEQEKARMAAEQARAAEAKARAEERAKLEQQARDAQQMNAGTVGTLKAIPKDEQNRYTRLALSLALRCDARLENAIGKLPPTDQAEIMRLIADMLSESEERIADAEQKLADKDAEAEKLKEARDHLRLVEIPRIQKEAEKAEAAKQEVEKGVDDLARKVAAKAAEYERAEREAGSWQAFAWKLIAVLVSLVGGYIFLAFIMPAVVKTMKPGTAKTTLRSLSGHLTAPILYRDADKKLSARKVQKEQ